MTSSWHPRGVVTSRRATTIWKCQFWTACCLKSQQHKRQGLCGAESMSGSPDVADEDTATPVLFQVGVPVPALCLLARVRADHRDLYLWPPLLISLSPGLSAMLPSRSVFTFTTNARLIIHGSREEQQLLFLTVLHRLLKPPLNSSGKSAQGAAAHRPFTPAQQSSCLCGKWRKTRETKG